jgi:hypothetical protein
VFYYPKLGTHVCHSPLAPYSSRKCNFSESQVPWLSHSWNKQLCYSRIGAESQRARCQNTAFRQPSHWLIENFLLFGDKFTHTAVEVLRYLKMYSTRYRGYRRQDTRILGSSRIPSSRETSSITASTAAAGATPEASSIGCVGSFVCNG